MEYLTLPWKRSRALKYNKNSYFNFDFKKSLKLGIVVLVMFNKMLAIVIIIDFYFEYGPGSQKPSLSSVSFGNNVP